ncbi:MAG: hypothetical protein RL637_360 [Pseudomonadota bacterium]|jgi:membrane-bound lytic murein transglycosylase D
MIRTHFNRSLGYLCILTALTATGCSQQPTNHLVINDTAENPNPVVVSADEVAQNETNLNISPISTAEVNEINNDETIESLPVAQVDQVDTTTPPQTITAVNTAEDSNDVALAAAIKAIHEAPLKTELVPETKKIIPAAVLAKTAAKNTVAKAAAENIAADAAAKSVDEASAASYEAAKKEEAKEAKDEETKSNASKSKSHLNANSLWKRLFSLYALPEVDNPRVEQELQNFLKHPNHLLAIQKRAEPFLYLILQEIESKKIPGELALLPIIESSFQVGARSPMDAVGLWQFIPATGNSFGLRQDWWYDGRKDVYASTEAATSYLKQLNRQLDGNWLLTLASYNWGVGNVQRAVRRNAERSLDTNYWSLNLPRETMEYVPKLLAVAKLFAHAEEYNLPLKNIPNQPFLKAVNIDAPLDLSKAAEMADMSWDEFASLNPGFKRTISPEGNYRLLIKIKHAATFRRKLAKLAPDERIKWIEHTIKVGEDLNSIAKQHDISVRSLVEINRLQNKPLIVGSILHIPPTTDSFRADT